MNKKPFAFVTAQPELAQAMALPPERLSARPPAFSALMMLVCFHLAIAASVAIAYGVWRACLRFK